MTPKVENALLPQTFTPKVMEKMRKEWLPREFASALDIRVRAIEEIGDMTFVELGMLVSECERNPNELWRQLGYARWTSWMASGKNGSKAKRYAARAAFMALTEINIPIEEGSKLKRGSAQVLAKVSRQNRPKLIEAAKTMEVDELRKKIEKEYPNEHIESKAPMRFSPDKSQRHTIDTCLQAVMMLEDLPTREDAFESICADWLESHKVELEEAYAVI